jgi:hypothetical protein
MQRFARFHARQLLFMLTVSPTIAVIMIGIHGPILAGM